MPHLKKTISWWLAQTLSAALNRLKPEDAQNLGSLFAQRFNSSFTKGLDSFAQSFIEMRTNFPNKIDQNGELWLIKATVPHRFTTLFDVGANIGKWSEFALIYHDMATVHAFEIVPATFEILDSKFSKRERIFLNSLGLSDSIEDVTVYIDDESNLLSSILDFDNTHNKKRNTINVRVSDGDTYAQNNNIKNIDFLKIDVEGAESKVLKGFEKLLSRRGIRLIQFEYNRGAIISHFLLRDFYALLTKYGYVLGWLTPKGVVFRDYELRHENFVGPNYVACLHNDYELIRSISEK